MHNTRSSQQQKTIICLYINNLDDSYRHVHIIIAENAGRIAPTSPQKFLIWKSIITVRTLHKWGFEKLWYCQNICTFWF